MNLFNTNIILMLFYTTTGQSRSISPLSSQSPTDWLKLIPVMAARSDDLSLLGMDVLVNLLNG